MKNDVTPDSDDFDHNQYMVIILSPRDQHETHVGNVTTHPLLNMTHRMKALHPHASPALDKSLMGPSQKALQLQRGVSSPLTTTATATSTSTAAATKKDAKKAASNKRKRGSGAAASDADATATVAIGDDGGDSGACHPQPQRRSLPSSIATPDVCLLLPKAQTAATTEPLNLWFEAFALAVRQEDERIAAQKLAEEQAAAAVDADANGRGGAKKRGKGGATAASTTAPVAPTLTREEILHVAYANRALRVRFFHALFQLERAGWCSSTFSVDRGVVRVTRHFFVGV